MSFEPALTQRLLARAEIATLVGTGVDFGRRRPGRPLPAITLMIVSDRREQNFKGFDRVRATWLQIDVWAETAKQAQQLRELVIETLAPPAKVGLVQFQASQDIRHRQGFDQSDTSETNREIIDLTLWHNG